MVVKRNVSFVVSLLAAIALLLPVAFLIAQQPVTLQGTSEADVIVAGAEDTLIAGGPGDDFLIGGSGDDVFFIEAGDGHDTVSAVQGYNIVEFGNGITYSDVASGLWRVGDDLSLRFAQGEQSVTVKDFFALADTIAEFRFQGGESLASSLLFQVFGVTPPTAQLGTRTVITVPDGDGLLGGTEGPDLLVAMGGDTQRVWGRAGADYLIAPHGNVTFEFTPGSGKNLVIAAGGENVVLFRDGINFADVAGALQRHGDDLVLGVAGTGDQVRVHRFFALANTIERVAFESGGEITADVLYGVFGVPTPEQQASFLVSVAGVVGGEPDDDCATGGEPGCDDEGGGDEGGSDPGAGDGGDEGGADPGDDEPGEGEGDAGGADPEAPPAELQLPQNTYGLHLLVGTVGDDFIFTGPGDNLVVPGPGADIIVGGPGNNRYFISAGGGQDIIADVQGTNIIEFDADIAYGDVASGFMKSGNDLVLRIGDDDQRVTVKHFFAVANTLAEIHFSNGWVITSGQLYQLFGLAPPAEEWESWALHPGAGDSWTITGTAGPDVLIPRMGAKVLRSLEGRDYLIGRGEGVTFEVEPGASHNHIVAYEGENHIAFKGGIQFSDIATGMARVGDDLVLSSAQHDVEVRIHRFFDRAPTVEAFHFEDGSALYASNIFSSFSVQPPQQALNFNVLARGASFDTCYADAGNSLGQGFGLTADQLAEPNQAPEFTSIPTLELLPGRAYQYVARAHDPENHDLCFSLVSGPQGMVITADTGVLHWHPEQTDVGDHPVELAVTDERGAGVIQAFTLSVLEHDAPTAVITGDSAIVDGDALTLDASESTGVDGIASYRWIDPVTGEVLSEDAVLMLEGLPIGQWTFVLELTDAHGVTSSHTVEVSVTAKPPVIVLEEAVTVPVGTELTLDASASHDPYGGALIFRWFALDSGQQIGDQPTLHLGTLAAGTAAYRLQVESEAGLVSEVTTTVTAGYMPVAVAPEAVSAYAHMPIEIDGSASAVTEGELHYRWVLDGEVVSEAAVAHIDGLAVGSYTVELVVTTEHGLSDTALVTVHIDEARALAQCPAQAVTDDRAYLALYPEENIDWLGGSAATVEDIERAFNFAREQDPSIFRYLIMPSQAAWDAMSLQAKGLYLVNAERAARDIKPYEGHDPRVVSVAQYFADYIREHNQIIGHYNDGQTPTGRLDADPYILEHRDAHIVPESIASGWGFDESLTEEYALVRAIFSWLYQDKDWFKDFEWADSGAWKHRDHLLQTGLNENSGSAEAEGLVGFGVTRGDYAPESASPDSHGYVVVFNTIDQGAAWDLAQTGTVDVSAAQGCNTAHLLFIDPDAVTTEGLAHIQVEPASLLMTPGDSQALQVTGIYEDGAQVDFTPYAHYVPDHRSVVSVNLGQVTALQEGQAQVFAQLEGVQSNRLHVRVRQATDLAHLAGTGAEALLPYLPANATVDRYDPLALAVYSGRVKDRHGQPLADVQVSFLNRPGYGSVRTNADGRFIIAGSAGRQTLIYEKSGHLVVQRPAIGASMNWAVLDDVTLLPRDTKRTRIDLTSGAPQVHQSSVVSDQFGERRATVVFNGITSAVIRSADGSERPLDAFWLTATEYEVPSSMPGPLPPETAFTYATDLHVAGVHYSDTVVFDSDVVMFVDNFLGFEVGEIVPIGYFDRLADRWIASPNGVVVQLVDQSGDGIVDGIDYTGDGLANDLSGSGVTWDDAIGLAGYSPGDTLWWGRFNHFTPLDYNWASADAEAPTGLDVDVSDEDPRDDECAATGSYAKPYQQTHHEDIGIAGTDISLHYSSQRTDGYRHRVRIRVSGEEISPSLERMIARLEVAGRVFEQSLAPAPNQEVEFIWDGTSVGGDRPKGLVSGRVSIGYEYPTVYLSSGNAAEEDAELEDFPVAWATVGDTVTAVPGREAFISWQSRGVTFKNSYDRQLADGWSLSAVHEYDPAGQVYLGSGGVREVASQSLVLKTGQTFSLLAGDDGYYQRGGSATDYAISDEGILVDRVTGLEWQYVDVPAEFRTRAEAAQYCAQTAEPRGTGWRLPTAKEVGYTINKSGANVGPMIYSLSRARQLWHQFSANPDERLKPVLCVRGETLNQRYVTDLKRDAGQEVVLDQQNGLMWQDMPANASLKLDWEDSIQHCEASSHAGYDDWRLPNINELLYVLPNNVFAHQTTLVFPPGELWSAEAEFRQLYWSSTTNHQNSAQAWAIESESFNSERLDKADAYHVRCVRDAASASRMPFRFDNQGRHLATIDLDSGVTLLAFEYDDNDRLSAIEDRFGNRVLVERSAGGTPIRIVGPNGEVTELVIDEHDHLLGVIYPDGSQYQFGYGPDGLLTSKTTPNGHLFERQYDVNGRLLRTSDPEGGLWEFFSQRLAPGHERYGYTTAENNLYQTERRLLADGDLQRIITAKHGTETLMRLRADRLKETREACGVTTVTDKVRDPRTLREIPHVITVTQPSGLTNVTTLTKAYAENGADTTRYTVTADSGTGESTVSVDARTGVIAHTTAEGRGLTQVLDVDTRQRVSVAVAGLTPLTYEYDQRGRMTRQVNGDRVTQYHYNAEGLLAEVVAPNGLSTHYEYDLLGRVSRITYPDGHSTQSVYDANGNQTTIVVPTPADHGFDYNSVDRLVESTAPLTEPTRYEYDRDRRLTAIVLPSGERIEHTYAQGRLARTDTPEGAIEYDYQCGGRLSELREGLESLTYTWDGDLLTGRHYQGELNESILYGYNDQFALSQLSYAGASTTLGYDADGLLTGIHGFSILRHAEHGLPTQVSDAALSQTRGYNAYGEPSALAYSLGAGDMFAYQLERNAMGQITARTETLPDGSTRQYHYGYDDRSRLSTVHRDGVLVEAYQYDANGNRMVYTSTLRGRHGVSAGYDLGDQLQTSGDSSYAYDANGRLAERTTAGVTTHYQYSSLGRLERVETPDKLIEYRHNAFGNRVAKLVDGEVVERYLWQDLTTLLAVYDGNGTLKQRFEYTVGHTPSKFTQDGQSYYLLTDHLGSPRVIADAQGSVVKTLDYDAYGNVIHDSNPGFTIPFGFAGGLYDTDTNLIRFGYRDYDPDTGRWTARDPIGFAGGDTNLYGYVFNSPVNWIDPYGLEAVGAVPAAGGSTVSVPGWARNPAGFIVYSITYSKPVGLGSDIVPAGPHWSQSDKRPKNCPAGTLDIDRAKKKFGWDKDKLHGIKDSAHGGMGTGKSWTGVAPDGTVGINEDGEWSPQGHWEDLL